MGRAISIIISVLVITIIGLLIYDPDITGFAVKEPEPEKKVDKIKDAIEKIVEKIKEKIEERKEKKEKRDKKRSSRSRNIRPADGTITTVRTSSSPDESYNIVQIPDNVKIYENGILINISNTTYVGLHRFQFRINKTPIVDFDLSFSQSFNLSNITLNYTEDKAIFNDHLQLLQNTTWYIPKKDYHKRVRICENATQLNQIEENCSVNSAIGSEYVVGIEGSQLSEHAEFFLLRNSSQAGAVSERDYLFSDTQLIGPQNVTTNVDIEFLVNLSDSTVQSCSLFVDGVENISNSMIVNVSQNLTIRNISIGMYAFEVECVDNASQLTHEQTRMVTVFKETKFDGSTTDLDTLEDLENVTDFVIEDTQSGIIEFLEPLNLSGGVNIDDFITINDNFIEIDSENIPQLNKSARLTFYNLSVKNPTILRNSVPCTDCEITSYDDHLVFTVQHFSTYVAAENSQMTIFDDTETTPRFPNNQITFYANYTNTTTGRSINGTGVFCNITFSDTGTENMTFHNDTELYTYNRSFNTTGVFYYDVSCDGSALLYTILNATDYASINDFDGPLGVTSITINSSSRGNDTLAPVAVLAQAGNTTELTFNSTLISKAWQGFVGEVTGLIALKSPQENRFYDWGIVAPSGEIYASRASDVNFPTINCSTSTQVSNEDTYISKVASDIDSVNRTFNLTTHPGFDVGNLEIEEDRCQSTNLYVNNESQTNQFYEVLLSDSADNMVYTALLENDQQGFDGQSFDFQMIVAENGQSEGTTNYYFFIELT